MINQSFMIHTLCMTSTSHLHNLISKEHTFKSLVFGQSKIYVKKIKGPPTSWLTLTSSSLDEFPSLRTVWGSAYRGGVLALITIKHHWEALTAIMAITLTRERCTEYHTYVWITFPFVISNLLKMDYKQAGEFGS